MGQVHKIGDSYYIEFEARGLKYQQNAGPHEAKAWELLAEIEAKIQRGEMGAMVRDVPLQYFIKEFQDFAKENFPPRTQNRLVEALQHFFKFTDGKYPNVKVLSGITPKVVEEYKFSLRALPEQKPWVINFTLILLREVFEYAIKMGYLNDNPTLHIRFLHDERRTIAAATKNRVAREALERGVSLFRLAKLLNCRDILRMMPFGPFLRNPIQI